MKVFLGGTCNGSTWREHLIPGLTIDYYNPVVKDWTEDCQKEEVRQRKECDICLYVITPKMMGCYSIAEAVDDSNKRPKNTVLCVIKALDGEIFSDSQMNSLLQVCKMVQQNGARVCYSLTETVRVLNGFV